jgi:curved DNA-binding protein CbpA
MRADKNPDKPAEAAEKFKEVRPRVAQEGRPYDKEFWTDWGRARLAQVGEAYDVLSDKQKREIYDR